MLYERMRAESQRLEKQINSVISQLEHLPAGNFFCTRNGKYYKWYRSAGEKQEYLPKKERALAEQLAYKKYLSLLLEELLQKKQIADAYLEQYVSIGERSAKLISDHPEYQQLIAPFYHPLSKEHLNWANAPYEKNPQYPEQLIHKTLSGNLVRSKSEMIIADALYTHKIPFRYENSLYLNPQMISPDFTILHPDTGKIYFWEHFGLMDDVSYRKSTASKLNSYISNGIIPSIQLITTYERYAVRLRNSRKQYSTLFSITGNLSVAF